MSKFVLTAQLKLQAPNNVAQVVSQMQRQLNNIQVDVQVRGASAAQKDLKGIASETEKVTSRANQMGKAFAVSIKRFAAFSIATRAVGLLTTSLGGAVAEAIKFERELIKVAQVTGKTVSQLSDLVREIDHLATTMGVASNSLLEVSRSLSQAGLSAKDTKIALESLAKTSLAPTFANITQTTEGAIAVMAQFKEGAGALEKQLGSINAVAGQFAVEAGDLISVIRRTGGVFKEAGGDLSELIGLFTSVRATTRESADSIATGLRTIFTRIQRPKTIEFMKQFGVQLTDMDGKFVGAYEGVRRLSEALKGLEQGDIRFIRIAEELGGFRQIGKVIPLLKEFKTAEEARQAAVAGGDSLTKDMAAAQQTLAVKLIKVKEEFLKLIREVTQTQTFKVMADSALALASSLITIADAIKPLMPLLAALAAFKMAKAFGSFGSGLVNGIKNVGATGIPGKNKGGRIEHFARGGMVPGQGSRDTVPAMLQPGEFVIKKSSVNQIGSKQLGKMNKYGLGGPVNVAIDPNEIGLFGFRQRSGGRSDEPVKASTFGVSSSAGLAALERFSTSKGKANGPATPVNRGPLNAEEKAFATDVAGLPKTSSIFKSPAGKNFLSNPGEKGTRGLFREQWGLGAIAPGGGLTTQLTKTGAQTRAAKGGTGTTFGTGRGDGFKKLDSRQVNLSGSVSTYNPRETAGGSLEGLLEAETASAMSNIVEKVATRYLESSPAGIPKGATINTKSMNQAKAKLAKDDQVISTAGGYAFEGIIEALTGSKFAGGTTAFDFPMGSISPEGMETLFDGVSKSLIKGDAKPGKGSVDSVASKVRQDIQIGDMLGVKPKAMAKGGKASDTVPAMLTPGEFVFNKKAARSIGYGSLNTMNKKGVTGFADGGPVGVQHFAEGGGVMPTGGGADTGFLKGLKSDSQMLEGEFFELSAKVSQITTTLEMNKSQLKTFASSIAAAGGANKATIAQEKLANTASQNVVAGQNKLKAAQQQLIVVTEQKAAADRKVTAETVRLSAAEAQAEQRLIESKNRALTVQNNPAAAGALNSPSKGKGNTQSKGDKAGKELTTFTGQVKEAKTELGLFEMDTKEIISRFQVLQQVIKQELAARGVTNQSLGQHNAGLLGSSVATNAVQQAETKLVVETNKLARSTKKAAKGAEGAAKGSNRMMGAMIGIQTIMAMLPAQIEETDGALAIMGKTIAKSIMTMTALAFVLTGFGLELSASAVAAKITTLARGLEAKSIWLSRAGHTSAAASTFALSRAAHWASASLMKLGTAGVLGLAAILIGLYAVGSAMQAQAKKVKDSAIETGDADTAGNAAVQESAWGVAKVLSVLAAVVAAAALLIFTTVGLPFVLLGAAAAGLAVLLAKGLGVFDLFFNQMKDFFALFGMGDSTSSIKMRAEADALASLATIKLKTATEEAAEAMKEVSAGTKTAVESLQSPAISEAYSSAADALNAETASRTEDSKGFWESALNLIGNAAGFGSGQRMEVQPGSMRARVRMETIQQTQEAGGVGKGSEALVAAQEAQGITPEDLKAQKTRVDAIIKVFKETENLRARAAKEQIMKGSDSSGALITQSGYVAEQVTIMGDAFKNLPLEKQKEVLKDLRKEYENQTKAVIDNTKRALAFNFGLRGIEGSVALASSRLDNLSSAFDTGTVQVRASINKLNAVLESGSAMDPAELKESLNEVNKELQSFGVDPRTADKLTKSFEALNAVQGSFRNVTEEFIADSVTNPNTAGLSTEEFNNQLKDSLRESITSQTGDADTAKNLVDSMPELSEKDVAEIMGGNLSSIEDKFGDINDKLVRELEILSKIADLTEKVAQANANRLESEGALFDAQKKSISLQREAAKIIGEFGGTEFGAEKKRTLALKTANVGTSRSGLSDLKTGSVSEIRRRNEQIKGSFGAIQSSGRSRVEAGEKFFGEGPKVQGGAFSSQGQEVEAQANSLKQAQEEQISTIKALIEIEKEHLKTIEEKNRLERESLDSLINGDIESFLNKQAASGATAAIASGDTRMAGLFGATAMSGAFSNLKKQQEGGVQSVFGQKIGGSGGLLERSAGAALGSRGITDPRQAALLAGTTAKEEDSKRRIRGLAGELSDTGSLGADMAGMDLENAEFKVKQATIIVTNAQDDAQKKSKEAADIRQKGVDRGNEILKRTENELVNIEAQNEAIAEYERVQAEMAEEALNPGSIYVHDIHAGKTLSDLEKKLTTSVGDEGLAEASGARSHEGKRKLMTATQLISTSKAAMAGEIGKPLQIVAKGVKDTAAATKGLVTGTYRGLKAGQGMKSSLARGGRGAVNSFKNSSTGQGLGALGGNKFAQGARDLFRGMKSGLEFGKTLEVGKAGNRLTSFTADSAAAAKFGGTGNRAVMNQMGLKGSFKGLDSVSRKSVTAARTTTRSQRTGIAIGKAGNFMKGSKLTNPANWEWVKSIAKFAKSGKEAFSSGRAIGSTTTSMSKISGVMGSQAGKTAAAARATAAGAGKASGLFGKLFDSGAKMSKVFKPMKDAFNTAKLGGKAIEGAGRLAGTASKAGRAARALSSAGSAAAGSRAGQLVASTGGKVVTIAGKGAGILGKGLSVAGKVLGKVAAPLALAVGGVTGALEGDKTLSGTKTEGAILGAITGSATAGDSMLSGFSNGLFGTDIQKGSGTDQALGVAGAAATGAMTGAGIGLLIAPFTAGLSIPIAAGIGALVGAATEGYKILSQDAEKGGTKGIFSDGTAGGGTSAKAAAMQTIHGPATAGPFMGRQLGPNQVEMGTADRKRFNSVGSVSESQAQAVANRQGQVENVLPAGGGTTPGGAIAQRAAASGGSGGGDAMGQAAMSFAAGTERLAGALNKFNTDLSANINELRNLKFQVKLDTTNVNINFNGASFLETLSSNIKSELLDHITKVVIPSLKHDGAGNHTAGGGTGPT